MGSVGGWALSEAGVGRRKDRASGHPVVDPGVLVDLLVVEHTELHVGSLGSLDLLSQTGARGTELPDDQEDRRNDQDQHEAAKAEDGRPVGGDVAGQALELLSDGRDEIIINLLRVFNQSHAKCKQ